MIRFMLLQVFVMTSGPMIERINGIGVVELYGTIYSTFTLFFPPSIRFLVPLRPSFFSFLPAFRPLRL